MGLARCSEQLLMKRLLLLLCLIPALASATMTVTDRGTGGNNSSATTITVTPGSNLARNSWGVIAIALDNAGTSGASTICAASMIDSVGNIWVRQLDVLFDNGAASAGVEIAIYTGQLATAFTTSNTVVVTFSSSVVAKAWAMFEVVPTAGKNVYISSGGSAAGSTTGTPTVTSGSIATGDVIIGLCGAESADTFAGDADTLNGSWSTHQHAGFGTSTSGMSMTAQSKVVTSAGQQVYNPTLTSVDTKIGWMSLTENASATGRFFSFFP